LGNWIDHIKAKIIPPRRPSKMSQDEIAAELATLFTVSLLTDFDVDSVFAGKPAEDTFEYVIKFAMEVSLLIGGKPTSLPHSYASFMLYRICTVAGSVTEIYRRHEREPLTTLDYSSIAVLCRTIVDASVMYWYLTETVNDDEWAFRLAVLNVHDAASRVRLFKGLNSEEADNQRANLDALKIKLSTLALFTSRSEEEKAKLLSGQTMYVNGMRSLLKDMNIGKIYFDGLYNYLSAHVHLTPLSYFRMRQGDIDDVIFARGFMQLCLYEASRMVVRVALREIEISKITAEIDPMLLVEMKGFSAPAMGDK
jgi:hypothetical protein